MTKEKENKQQRQRFEATDIETIDSSCAEQMCADELPDSDEFSVSKCLERERQKNPNVLFPDKLYTGFRFTDDSYVLEWVHILRKDDEHKYTTGIEKVYKLSD